MTDTLGHWLMSETPASRRQAVLGNVYRAVRSILGNPTALGGLIIGLIETFVRGSHWSTYTDAIVFSILILILLFRPAGLLGKLQTEKV